MQTWNLILSLLPIGAVILLMLRFRWKSTHAGIVGWASALLIAGLRFGAGCQVLLWAQVRGLFLALYVLYIIWGALLFYRVTDATGTIKAMAEVLRRISPNRSVQVLLLAWGFASFLQSVSGFGVPVAIVAPLLVGMGFTPLAAVVLPSLGHAWAVTFGSLGSSFYALMAATGLEGHILAPWSANYSGIICLLTGAATLWAAGGLPAIRQGAAPLLLMGISAAATQWLVARADLWSIAAMCGSLAGLAVGSLWAFRRTRSNAGALANTAQLTQALRPYAILLGFILTAKFWTPLSSALDSTVLRVSVPEVTTALGWTTPAGTTRSLSLLGHTGALLIYASVLIFLIARRQGVLPPGSGGKILKDVTRRGLKSTVGVLAMVTLAATMDHAGMINTISETLAAATGAYFTILPPFIGALGAFVTGSNTNSNVLFGALQRDIAQALHYTVPLILAAQNVGASLGSTFAPAKVIVGCSTVDAADQESDVMRWLLRYDLAALGLLALFTWTAAYFL